MFVEVTMLHKTMLVNLNMATIVCPDPRDDDQCIATINSSTYIIPMNFNFLKENIKKSKMMLPNSSSKDPHDEYLDYLDED